MQGAVVCKIAASKPATQGWWKKSGGRPCTVSGEGTSWGAAGAGPSNTTAGVTAAVGLATSPRGWRAGLCHFSRGRPFHCLLGFGHKKSPVGPSAENHFKVGGAGGGGPGATPPTKGAGPLTEGSSSLGQKSFRKSFLAQSLSPPPQMGHPEPGFSLTQWTPPRGGGVAVQSYPL